MNITEKVSYIKGLAEGLELDVETKEGKVLTAIIDVLDDMAQTIEDYDSELDEVAEIIADFGDAIDDISEELYGDYDDIFDDEDDELYEITCPKCDNTITTDFAVLSQGEIPCPNCGELLEFDLDDECHDENCECKH